MRSVENSGLGTTTPVLAQPGRVPLLRMLFKGQRGGARVCESGPSMHFNPAMAVDVCDADGGPGVQCSVQSPVTAMHGLGGAGSLGAMLTWSNAFCSRYDNALQKLRSLLVPAEQAGLIDTIEYQQAKALLDKEESWNQFEHAAPIASSTCDRESERAEGLYNALNSALKASGGRAGPELPEGGGGPDTGSTVRTVAIVAGISVAVLGTVYLVGPLIRSLSKAGARRIR